MVAPCKTHRSRTVFTQVGNPKVGTISGGEVFTDSDFVIQEGEFVVKRIEHLSLKSVDYNTLLFADPYTSIKFWFSPPPEKEDHDSESGRRVIALYQSVFAAQLGRVGAGFPDWSIDGGKTADHPLLQVAFYHF